MDNKTLIIERVFEAPIETVWEALTNKDLMKQWYFDVSDFKPEVGFEFEFYGGTEDKKYLHKCRVVEAAPITRISYTWSYDGYTGQSLVTFQLFSEEKNRTRLKLTHSGLDTFPKDNPDLGQDNFNEGWNSILGQSLRNFVEKDSFTLSIRIRASLKEVWNIVLRPDKQWGIAFGGGTITETDWKENSSIIWKDTEGAIGANGIVEVHKPEEYLQLHYYDELKPMPEDALGDYYEKFRLRSENGECILSIEIGKTAKCDIPLFKEMWEKAIHIIKQLAENKKQTA
ncbi:MAG TPA: SRPBCC family protein [Flavitalea sp.]|nr:SRPBCC family protein [Flavitalea sp.]